MMNRFQDVLWMGVQLRCAPAQWDHAASSYSRWGTESLAEVLGDPESWESREEQRRVDSVSSSMFKSSDIDLFLYDMVGPGPCSLTPGSPRLLSVPVHTRGVGA